MAGQDYSKNFVEPFDFLFYYSPSIPYDFPRERVPKSLCEESLLAVYKCYSDFPHQSEEVKRGEACHKYSHEFNQCKRRRDTHLFYEIQQWETEKFTSLKPELKPIYINSVSEELQQLRKEFDSIPASEATAEKRWRINADVMQTKWRLDYLKKMFPNLSSN